jgi:hypothetical protein
MPFEDQGRSSKIYCRKCSQPLNLGQPQRCPECGLSFDPGNPRTYRRTPKSEFIPGCRRAVSVALLCLLLLGGGAWGWFYWGWRAEQPCIAAIIKAGGSVHRWGIAPPQVERLLGDQQGQFGFAFYRVISAKIGGDPACPTLEPLAALKTLQMRGPGVTDTSLKLAGTVLSLHQLTVVGASITNRGLAELRSVPGLRVLMLVDVPIDDAAVQYLEQLRSLRNLRIDQTRMSSRGISLLRQALPQTQVLSDIK